MTTWLGYKCITKEDTHLGLIQSNREMMRLGRFIYWTWNGDRRWWAVRDQPGDQVTRNNSTMTKINKVLGLGLGGDGMG